MLVDWLVRDTCHKWHRKLCCLIHNPTKALHCQHLCTAPSNTVCNCHVFLAC